MPSRASNRFPFYYEIKIIVVLWLLSPATEGSSILYRKFVHPILVKREKVYFQTCPSHGRGRGEEFFSLNFFVCLVTKIGNRRIPSPGQRGKLQNGFRAWNQKRSVCLSSHHADGHQWRRRIDEYTPQEL